MIQERPTGVSQLVDGVTSQNEILRNASLLLLISVAENNPILQKIIAFENGFEIALNVAAAEGHGWFIFWIDSPKFILNQKLWFKAW